MDGHVVGWPRQQLVPVGVGDAEGHEQVVGSVHFQPVGVEVHVVPFQGVVVRQCLRHSKSERRFPIQAEVFNDEVVFTRFIKEDHAKRFVDPKVREGFDAAPMLNVRNLWGKGVFPIERGVCKGEGEAGSANGLG